MALLPEGFFSDSSDDSEELSFPNDFSSNKKESILNENDMHPGKKLINAILERKVDEIKTLLENESVVNYCQDYRWTPLMHAASLGCCEVIELLLKNGAEVNWCNKFKKNALMYLCESNSFDECLLLKCCNLLVEAGAEINFCDENGKSPLIYATVRGNMQLVSRLIELGSDLEISDDDGWTAIFFAVDSGNPNMVQLLKDAGAILSLIDNNGRSLHDFAIARNHAVIAEIVKTESSGEDIKNQLLNVSRLSPNQSIMFDMPDYSVSDFNGFMDDALKTIIAADLGNLISIFKEKKIGFSQFLINEDEDWKALGVEMSFDRKKLLTYANRILQKPWSEEAFIKQHNVEFSLIGLLQFLQNSVRVIHILIATFFVCQRELAKQKTYCNYKKCNDLLTDCLHELQEFKILIKKINCNISEIHKRTPADYIGPIVL